MNPKTYNMPNGDVLLFGHLFDDAEADGLYQRLQTDIRWQRDKIEICGRSIELPRLTAWYGNPDKSYTYSGIQMRPHAWTPDLLRIKKRVEEVAEFEFSSVLLNLYRTGRDSVGWHSDNERELGRNPVIGSVSLGETRLFQMRHLRRKELPMVEIPLSHGSFLLMKGATQRYWQHQIPKTTRTVEPRINLTFRVIR